MRGTSKSTRTLAGELSGGADTGAPYRPIAASSASHVGRAVARATTCAQTTNREWSSMPDTILACDPSSSPDADDDVHLPQFHRPRLLPPLVIAAPALAGPAVEITCHAGGLVGRRVRWCGTPPTDKGCSWTYTIRAAGDVGPPRVRWWHDVVTIYGHRPGCCWCVAAPVCVLGIDVLNGVNPPTEWQSRGPRPGKLPDAASSATPAGWTSTRSSVGVGRCRCVGTGDSLHEVIEARQRGPRRRGAPPAAGASVNALAAGAGRHCSSGSKRYVRRRCCRVPHRE